MFPFCLFLNYFSHYLIFNKIYTFPNKCQEGNYTQKQQSGQWLHLMGFMLDKGHNQCFWVLNIWNVSLVSGKISSMYQSLSYAQLFGTPWNVAHQAPLSMVSLGMNIGVGSQSLLQGIFHTQGLFVGLLHCRQILYHLSQQTVYLIEVSSIQMVFKAIRLEELTACR